jgi:hypothetical protein
MNIRTIQNVYWCVNVPLGTYVRLYSKTDHDVQCCQLFKHPMTKSIHFVLYTMYTEIYVFSSL